MSFTKNLLKEFVGYKNRILNSKLEMRFIIVGLLTTLLTNILLQTFITVMPLWLSTFSSQIFNLIFGFFAYSYLVFKVKNIFFRQFIKFIILAFLTWQINRFFIYLLFYYLNINIRIAALLVIPILALFSFFFQKKFIY